MTNDAQHKSNINGSNTILCNTYPLIKNDSVLKITENICMDFIVRVTRDQ